MKRIILLMVAFVTLAGTSYAETADQIAAEKRWLEAKIKYYETECMKDYPKNDSNGVHKKWCDASAVKFKGKLRMLNSDPEVYFIEKADEQSRKSRIGITTPGGTVLH